MQSICCIKNDQYAQQGLLGVFGLKRDLKFSWPTHHTHLQTEWFEDCIQGFERGIALVVFNLDQRTDRDSAHPGELGLL